MKKTINKMENTISIEIDISFLEKFIVYCVNFFEITSM